MEQGGNSSNEKNLKGKRKANEAIVVENDVLHEAFHLKNSLANKIDLADGSRIYSTAVFRKTKGECNYHEHICRSGAMQLCALYTQV